MRWVLARSCDQNTGVVGSNNIVLLPTLDAQELTLRSMHYPVGTESSLAGVDPQEVWVESEGVRRYTLARGHVWTRVS